MISTPPRTNLLDLGPLFTTVLDYAADMVWIKDTSGRILGANTATARHLGYTREELLGKRVYDFHFHPGDLERTKAWEKTILGKGSDLHLVTLRTRKGAPLEVELRASVLENPQERGILVIARPLADDVKEQRLAKTLYEAFRRSNDVMFYCDRNGIILDINDAFARHYGWTRQEVIGRTPAILRSRHTSEEVYKRMWAAILDPKKGSWRGEIINKAKDGREIPLILTITAVRDQKGEVMGYVSNATDLSEQVALQARVAHSEALATIGEMAAVVAHEIRNPLGSIVMAAKQLASGQLGKDDHRMVLQVLRGESQRLNEALTNFLSYARPREAKLQPQDLNAIVEEVVNIVKGNTELCREVRVTLRLDRKLKEFPMDPDQVRQVTWNIVLNALQSMDGRGVLSVETGRSHGHAFFRVKDTGPGIAPEALKAIFKPFHTTKQQGTGLGLAIAERIITSHGGKIEVSSEPGRGAVFSVYLPSVEE